jgi:hypothetical protein
LPNLTFKANFWRNTWRYRNKKCNFFCSESDKESQYDKKNSNLGLHF